MAKTKSNHEEVLSLLITEEKKRFPSVMTDSEFFEIFSAQQILRAHDLSDKEIESGIVGDGNDGGIDGLYFFINGQLIQDDVTNYDQWKKDVVMEVFVIQAKTTAGFGEEAILKLINATDDLFTITNNLSASKFKQRYTPKLLEIAGRFTKGYRALVTKPHELRFHYVYSTKGDEVHPNTDRLTEKVGKKIKELFHKASFDFVFLGAKELARIADSRPSEKIEIDLMQSPLYSGHHSCVCLVKLTSFYEFLVDANTKKINRHIFEANVRDYQGDVSVNKEIRDTLEHTGDEDFWWLNNGITILTSGITPKGNTALILDTPEIVNGLQTSNEVYNYFSTIPTDKLEQEEREILLRIIEPQGDKSRDKIIKATNNQTKIPPIALKASDPVHRNIEQYLIAKGLYYDRRKNFYKNEGKPQEQIVSISELAQAMIAIKLARPDDARARPSSILGDDHKYTEIFSDKIPLELYYAVLQIMDDVKQFLAASALTANERTNMRYYVAYYVTCLSCSKAILNVDDILSAPGLLTQQLISQAINEVKVLYEKAGGDDSAAKGTHLRESIEHELLVRFHPEIAKARAKAKRKKVTAGASVKKSLTKKPRKKSSTGSPKKAARKVAPKKSGSKKKAGAKK